MILIVSSFISIFKFIFVTRIIFNNLFPNSTTKAWIGLNRTNNNWTWSDGEKWNDDNPQLGNIGMISDQLQAYTCGSCRIEVVSLNNPFAAPQFQLCEKQVD